MSSTALFVLDSRDRVPSDPIGSYRIFLPRTYKRVRAARLVSAELPTSFYVFRDASLVVNGQTVPVRDGNYDANGICVELGNALETALGVSWDVTLDPVSMKLTMGCGAPFVLTRTPLAELLGFDTFGVAATEATAARVARLNPETCILLDIPQLNGVDESALDGGELGAGCFAKVPLTTNSFGYVAFAKKHPFVKPFAPVPKLDRIDVRWRWHSGEIVDFNGVDHSLTLEFALDDPAGAPPLSADNKEKAVATPTRNNKKEKIDKEEPDTRPPAGWSAAWLVVACLLAAIAYYCYNKQ